jgi:hypothetical protein
MLPALAFPYNDPDGTLLPHLQAILPDLKSHFERAYICPPLSTRELVQRTDWIHVDDFFTVFPLDKHLNVGEHFAYLYQLAAEAAPAEQAIHLCYVDRLSFALEGKYRDAFLADVDSVSRDELPLIFHRSPLAWDTHPQNYRDIEVYYLQENIHTKDVDWLAWEDPFIFSRDAAELKRERETSVEESQKRLAYAIPMIEFLTKQSKDSPRRS